MKKVDYVNGIPIIDDDTPNDFVFPTDMGRGHDASQYIPQMLAKPSELKLIDPSEYDARYEEQQKEEASLEHVYLRAGWENLDQNGQGFCWAYSIGQAIMMLRSLMNQPHVRLSPHAVACKIKNFRDEGGWCGLSAKFARETGYPSVDNWKEKSMSRTYDTAQTWENAALHKVTEDFYDLERPVYDQVLSERQVDTCSFLNIPQAWDFNWWAHSVCGLRKVKVEAGSWGRLILNSWKGWGNRGLGILRGTKARPDGAVALAVTNASVQ